MAILNNINSLVEKLSFSNIVYSSKLLYSDNVARKRYENDFLFHTNFCLKPFVVFELKETKYVELILFKNRVGSSTLKKRATSLTLCVSLDGFKWTNTSLSFDSDMNLGAATVSSMAKFIRFSLDEPGVLHLKEVSVECVDILRSDAINLPELRFTYGCVMQRDFYPLHNAGFFSICSTILYHLASVFRYVNGINAKYSFEKFKEGADDNPWLDYFLSPKSIDPKVKLDSFSNKLLHHTKYSNLNFFESQVLIDAFFSPSSKVNERIDFFRSKYQIDFSKTISVCIRGTDKSVEVKPVPVQDYLDAINHILVKNPTFRVLIQTDQKQIRDFLIDSIGDRVFFIDELPVTETSIVIHSLIKTNHLEFAINLLAIVHTMSKCHYVVTHTGNVAYWTVLFRGNSDNVVQF